MPYIKEVYAANPETQLYKRKSTANNSKQRKVLMGSWLGVLEEHDSFYKVRTFGKESYVLKQDVSDNSFLKAFFIDVGQGDATLIETPKKTIIVDGGPNKNLYNYLTKWKYKWIIQAGEKVKIDTIVISHFDFDHYKGINYLISDPNFEIGTIFHNGIARFHDKSAQRNPIHDTDLGETNYVKNVQQRTILKTSFNDLDDAQQLIDEIPMGKKGLSKTFKDFLEACLAAKAQGRLRNLKRITNRTPFLPGYGNNQDLSIEVLGPIPTRPSGLIQYDWFEDSSHTRNGHSIVLKLDFKTKTLLLGGDLNTKSEKHLLDNTPNNDVFQVDVAKSCHHGSSDFEVDFMEKLNPFATVISSGDNESYSHPRADAIGCAGKYARGIRPMVFSTELARSYSSGRDIHYGLINLRTDGNQIVMAQMKESKSSKDLWDSYVI